MTIKEFVSRLKNVKESSAGYTALCPGHDDQKNSLSISEGEAGKILLYCHAGCGTTRILVSMNLQQSDLFPKQEKQEQRRVEKSYPYVDEAGNLLYEVVRFIPKGFAQRRPDGKGDYIWNLGNVRKVLYRLPEVIEAIKANKLIYVVEGEKDSDNMTMLGYTVTTNSGGADKWQPEFADSLIGANVVIIPDNDDAGRIHAAKVAKSLKGKAKSIKVVELPDMPIKGDITDFFKKHDKTEGMLLLSKLVESAQEYEKPRQEHLISASELSVKDFMPIEFIVNDFTAFWNRDNCRKAENR